MSHSVFIASHQAKRLNYLNMYVDKAGFPSTGLASKQQRSQVDRQPVAGKTKPKKGKAFLAGRIVTGTGSKSFSITDENSSQPVAEEKYDTLLNTTISSAPVFDGYSSFENAPTKPNKPKSILRDTTNRAKNCGGGPIRDKHQKKRERNLGKKDEVNVEVATREVLSVREASASSTFEADITFVEETVDLDAIKSLVNHDFDREEDVVMKHARRRLLFTQTTKSLTPNNNSESNPFTSTKEAVNDTSTLGKTFNYFYVEGEEASFTTIIVPFDDTKRTEGGLKNNKFEIESCLKEAVEIFEDLRTEMASVFSVSEWQNYLVKMPNKINSTCHVLKSKIY